MKIFLLSALYFSLTPCLFLKAEPGSIMNRTEDTIKYNGSLIGVKPEYRERYIILHKYTFPDVLERIRKSNIRNYSIFLLNDILFSHYEYIGSNFEKDMEDIADPVTKDWWKLTDPMQQPLETRKEGEWWAEMELLLSLNKIIKPSSNTERAAFTAEIVQGSEENLKKLFSEFPDELQEEIYKNDFQNCKLYYKDGQLYFYAEYTGNNIKQSFSELNKSKFFSDFLSNLSKFLAPKSKGAWEQMTEVFHTN